MILILNIIVSSFLIEFAERHYRVHQSNSARTFYCLYHSNWSLGGNKWLIEFNLYDWIIESYSTNAFKTLIWCVQLL